VDDAEAKPGFSLLAVAHDGPRTVRAVAVRDAAGGPWLVSELIAPPGRPVSELVRLPATSRAMTFLVRGLADGQADPRSAAALFETWTILVWPSDRVRVAPVRHPPVAEAFAAPPPAWSANLKAQVLIVLATGTALSAFALLPRRWAWLRAALVVATAAGTTAAVAGLLSLTPLVARRTMHIVGRYDGRSWMTTVTRLAARRTGTARLRLEGPAWCAYGSVEAMAADRTVLRSAGRSVLADTDVICPLRPGRPQVLLSTARPPRGAPLPATVTVSRDGGARTLRSDRDTPPAIWIEGDRAARIAPLETAAPRTLDTAALRPLDQVDDTPLLRWWSRTARPADRPALVWWTTLGGYPALYVSEVEVLP